MKITLKSNLDILGSWERNIVLSSIRPQGYESAYLLLLFTSGYDEDDDNDADGDDDVDDDDDDDNDDDDDDSGLAVKGNCEGNGNVLIRETLNT